MAGMNLRVTRVQRRRDVIGQFFLKFFFFFPAVLTGGIDFFFFSFFFWHNIYTYLK